MILQSKDRPKIRNLNKIQDTCDVVEIEDTRHTGIEGNLLPIKKVKWKDNADTKRMEKIKLGRLR